MRVGRLGWRQGAEGGAGWMSETAAVEDGDFGRGFLPALPFGSGRLCLDGCMRLGNQRIGNGQPLRNLG